MTCARWLFWVWLLAAAQSVLGNDAPVAPVYAPEHADLIRAAAEAYLANREAFPFFDCRFTVTKGKAASLADALAGKLDEPAVEHGVWIVDGPRVRYEAYCDHATLAAALENNPTFKVKLADGAEANAVRMPCNAEGFLTDGRIHLRYAPTMESANIRAADSPLPGIECTPWSLQMMGQDEERSPGRLLLQGGKADHAHIWLDAEPHGEPEQVLVVALGPQPSGQAPPRRRFFLDPERGYLPVRIDLYYPQKFDEAGQPLPVVRAQVGRILDVLACSNERWFPRRTVTIGRPDGDPPFQTTIIEVTSLNADERPSEDLFHLDVSKDTTISNPDDLRSVVGVKEEQRIHLRNLPGFLEQTTERLQQARARDEEERQAGRGASGLRRWLVLANVAILALAAALLYAARRRKNR